MAEVTVCPWELLAVLFWDGFTCWLWNEQNTSQQQQKHPCKTSVLNSSSGMLVDDLKSYYICFRGKTSRENKVNEQLEVALKACSQTLIPD